MKFSAMPLLAALTAVCLVAACGNGASDDDADAGADIIEDDAADGDADGGEAGDDVEPDTSHDGRDAQDVDEEEIEPGSWDEPFEWPMEEPNTCPVEIGENDRYGELLDAIGLDRDAGLPRSLFESFGGRVGSDPTRLDIFHVLADDPGRIPCWSGNLAGRADAAVASDHPRAAVIAMAAAELGRILTVGGRLPAVDADEPLVEAIRAVHEAAGESFDSEDAVRAAAAGVPGPVAGAAALILLAAVEARTLRDEAIANMGNPDRLAQYYGQGSGAWLPGGGMIDPDVPFDSGMFLNNDFGFGRLFTGAVKLAQAIDEAALDEAAVDESFSFSATTPWGMVVLGGSDDDTYDPEEFEDDMLLLLDTGGSDTYLVNAGGSGNYENPISVAIDLGGDDRYAYPEEPSPYDEEGLLPSDRAGRYRGDDNWGSFTYSLEPRQGAGVTGYGFLLDLGGGNDVYRTLRRGQGFATFGVGVQWDDGGADDYVCEAGCQGSAIVGIGIQYDGGGDDTRRAFNSVQGFAWVSSFGMLYDAGGNDEYVAAIDDPIVYHSAQCPGYANSSLAQGTAFGWRRDSTGTHLSGGIALLRDVEGDDSYQGATFVQGVGYWYGIGVLADASGSDHYDGLFYAQGAGAHFAIGSMIDGGEDDDYHNTRREPHHSMIGLGHDFSVAVMVDGGGNDEYIGPSRSIGAAKCHGFGLFVDNGGDDTYTARSDKAIGWATDYDWTPGSCGNSTTLVSYGFFVDIGGTDIYDKPDPTGYGNDLIWITDDPEDEDAIELSGGIDAADGDSYLWAYGTP